MIFLAGLCLAFVIPVAAMAVLTPQVKPEEKDIMDHMMLIRRFQYLQIIGIGVSFVGAAIAFMAWIGQSKSKPD